MTTGRINQVAFTCTHGYLAILGKFNQLSGRLKPSIPSTNITGNQCKQQSHPLKVRAFTPETGLQLQKQSTYAEHLL
jgi:hypothetical protein